MCNCRCWCVTARMATDTELEGMHRESHIRVVEGELPHPENVNTNDFYTNEHTPSAARLSAGCCIAATKAAVNGMLDRAFALIRPPGHHAEPCEAMGFCFFNNVSLATVCALQDPDVNRILIVDWDVHHGNGTQNMFYDEPRVMYVSLHRKDKGFYPGTGAIKEVGKGKGKGYTVNIGWTGPEFGDADYLAAFSVVVEPLCEAFDPDLIIVSSGFDAAEGDPLGEMRVTPECYAHLTHRLMAFASGQVVMALEGGYNVDQVGFISGQSPARCRWIISLKSSERTVNMSFTTPLFYPGGP
eukprot:evm.model.scf_2265.1 EVM.evm.TU.scf_2265.1   scf_2265:1430-2326(+)